MKNILHQFWKLLLVGMWTILAIGCNPSNQSTVHITDEPTLTVTATVADVQSTQTPSPKPPTETATNLPPTATKTTIPTLTGTPTEIPPSLTPTDEPLIASLSGYTVCRFGPGTIFPIHTSFKEDGSALVRGRLEDDSWFLIELPESGETCWIFHEIVELDKTTALLAILTPPPKPTPAPAPTQSEEEKQLGPKYYLIIPDNGGPFACGDGMVYFYSGKKSKDTEDDITVALNALFSVKTEFVGDYYNPIFKSSLKVKSVEVEGGHATIWLSGKFVKPNSVCQAKRIHLQVWETASRVSEVKHRPIIYVNNALLGDLLVDVKK